MIPIAALVGALSPRLWTLFGAVVLGGGLILSLYLSRQQIAALTSQVQAAQDRVVAAHAERDALAAQWGSVLTQLRAENQRLAKLWADEERSKHEAIAAAEHERAKIATQAADWRAQWESRPQACGSLLVEMEAACASLADY